ncbi:hypothetical protein EYF80_038892 [Liparis tanakae]|uniref:Uncharacterized protein n=1 Tax=Liparis tanakae TaxID=230148 RepID=A0A4Z2GCE5_9TELE|nr:hypothetical protein EYF80_038892 [Liparis tanakae]
MDSGTSELVNFAKTQRKRAEAGNQSREKKERTSLRGGAAGRSCRTPQIKMRSERRQKSNMAAASTSDLS